MEAHEDLPGPSDEEITAMPAPPTDAPSGPAVDDILFGGDDAVFRGVADVHTGPAAPAPYDPIGPPPVVPAMPPPHLDGAPHPGPVPGPMPGGTAGGTPTPTAPAGMPAPGLYPAMPGTVPVGPRDDEYQMYHWSPADQQRFEMIAQELIDYLAGDPQMSQMVRKFTLTRNVNEDRRQRLALEEMIRPHLANLRLAVRADEMSPILDLAYDELIGLGPLGTAWRDDAVTEILVDRWDRIYVERDGRLLITRARFRSPEHANSIARNLAQLVSDRALSPTNPLVSAQLDGARVNFAYSPVVASGLAISLRKFKPLMGMAGLLSVGSITPEMAEFLHDVVQARGTVLVSGGTGVGKTTLINALSEAIPDNERVITIEDSLELKLANRFVVSMTTKERASRDDDVIITQEMLMVNALRMRPDRIVVGEIRDPAAAATMLQAAMTGHDGTMTTIHASNADSALNSRFANLIRTGSAQDGGSGVSDDIAKYQIAEAFDLIVQGTRRRQRRFVEEIAEVGTNCISGDRIVPRTVFRATLDDDLGVRFDHVGGISRDGVLAEKMLEAGVDPSRWFD